MFRRAYDGGVLLAIDTSVGTSVALVDPSGPHPVAVRATEDTRRHAEVIGPFLADVFAESGTTPESVTHVVAGMGPGPFTGLRVGIAAARTFAAARRVPCLPVVSHDAVAAEHDGPLVVVTDARRHEVYWSAYDADHRRVAGPGLSRPDALDDALGPLSALTRVVARSIPAWRLAETAASRLTDGTKFDTDVPLYLRDPDVTMPGAPKRVRA